MNLIKYFKFYYKLTERKVLVVIVLAFLSSMFQALALAAIAAVSEQGNTAETQNIVAKAMYSMIDFFEISNENHSFAILLIIAALSFAGMSLFLIFTNIYIVDLQYSIYKKIQTYSMEQLMNVKYEYFSSYSIGHFNNVMISQLLTVASSFKFFTTIIVLTFSVLPFLFVPLAMNPKLALILGVILSLLILPLRWISKKTKEYSIVNVKEMTSLNSIMIQILSHYKYLKATEGYRTVFPRLRHVVSNVANISKRMVILNSCSTNAIMPIAIALICCLVYWQVAVENVSIMSAGFVLGLLYMASTRLNAIPVAYQKFVAAAGSILIYEKLTSELIDFHENITQKDSKQADFSGSLVFKDVTFKYKTGEHYALEDVSLQIQPFSSVAFVGGSGAGKSTIVNMISGLLKPSKGQLILSGTEYKDLDLSTLRAGIGYVTQEPVIFTDSVTNNISLWNSEKKTEKIQAAALGAHAHDFINALPDKYETLLGDHGVNISGGQRQRISIAREFLRETPILILDEATSALDSETEQVIQQSIDELKGKKTLIIIAHRLSTIKHCDVIYVLDEGKIVESGSYDKLISKNSLFKEMVDRQSL